MSQEFRLTTTDWLIGVYLSKLSDDLLTLNQGDYIDPIFNFTFILDDTFASSYEAVNAALFGQLDFDVGVGE